MELQTSPITGHVDFNGVSPDLIIGLIHVNGGTLLTHNRSRTLEFITGPIDLNGAPFLPHECPHASGTPLSTTLISWASRSFAIHAPIQVPHPTPVPIDFNSAPLLPH